MLPRYLAKALVVGYPFRIRFRQNSMTGTRHRLWPSQSFSTWLRIIFGLSASIEESFLPNSRYTGDWRSIWVPSGGVKARRNETRCLTIRKAVMRVVHLCQSLFVWRIVVINEWVGYITALVATSSWLCVFVVHRGGGEAAQSRMESEDEQKEEQSFDEVMEDTKIQPAVSKYRKSYCSRPKDSETEGWSSGI